MENLLLSFNVVLPLLLCIALGWFLRRIGMLEAPVRKSLNQLCFKVFLPIYLFNNISQTDIGQAFDVKLVAFGALGLLAIFAVLMAAVPRIEKRNDRRGVLVQGIFRANFALFGLPVAISLCGEGNVGPTSLMIGLMVPVYNVLAVVTLETFRGGKPSLAKIAKGIALNPLIIASLLGIAANLTGLRIPSAMQKALTDLGRVATPLSLVALGGEFVLRSVKEFWPQLTLGVAGKLVVCPLIMVTLGVLLGFRQETLVPVLLMFGAPTAVSSFPMAQQMGGDGELAASMVVFTSGFAILSIFLWVFFLKQMGLI